MQPLWPSLDALRSEPTSNVLRPAKAPTKRFDVRTEIQPTLLDVTMRAPAPTPQVDLPATMVNMRRAARVPLARRHPAPLASHVVLKQDTDRYSMSMTFSLGAYDVDANPVSHDGHALAPSWLALALRMSSDVDTKLTRARLRSMYAPMLNALVARLRRTVQTLLNHENLGLMAIEASIVLGYEDGRLQQLEPPLPDEPGMLGRHSSATIALRIDPLTSRMLRLRLDDYKRLKKEADIDAFDAHALSADANTPLLGTSAHDDPVPYGCEDLLWGQTISELLWLAGASMRQDVGRRDAEAFRQAFCDAHLLKVPNAPPHVEEVGSGGGAQQRAVHWRLVVQAMDVKPCL